MVDVYIGNRYSRIAQPLPPLLESELSDTISFQVPDYRHTPAYRERGWDGFVRLYRPGEPFMTGLMSYVRQLCEKYQIPYKLHDNRVRPEQNAPHLNFVAPEGYEDWPHQPFSAERAVKFTRGILQVATGGGKTTIISMLLSLLKTAPVIYLVPSRDLLYQAQDDLSLMLQTEIGIAGDGKLRICDVTIMTYQTAVAALHHKDTQFKASEYTYDSEDVWDEKALFGEEQNSEVLDLLDSCQVVYFDEVHHAAARTCQEVMMAMPNAYWRFGGSATPVRDDNAQIEIQGLFGSKIVEIGPEYLIRHGALCPARGWVALLDMPPLEYDSYRTIYKHAIVENEDYHKGVAEVVQMLADAGKLNLVLVKHIPHGKKLKALMPEAEFLTGRDTAKKRKRVIEAARQKKIRILIATSLADEGLDIKAIDAVHMVAGGGSITRVPQRIGRCLRKYPGKKQGMFVYYRMLVKHLYEQGQKAARVIKEEGAFEVKKVNGFSELKRSLADFINSGTSIMDAVTDEHEDRF